MNPEDIKHIVEAQAGHYLWLLLVAAAAFYLKDVIENLATLIPFLLSRDYNVDDEVFIDGRRARIVRQTLLKTVFYFEDKNTRLIVPNKDIHSLKIEKQLPGDGNEKDD